MGWRVVEFVCRLCDLRFEYLAETSEFAQVQRTCDCGGVADKVISAPLSKTIVRGNRDFAERETRRLDARADEHWKKHGKAEGIDRARQQLRKQMTAI